MTPIPIPSSPDPGAGAPPQDARPVPEVVPTVVGCDGVRRPTWADRSEAARAYFDTEWGTPVRDERGLLELLVLLGFAGGLTWSTVLARREALREAFAGYDADVLAAYDDRDVQALLHDARLVRNEHKIRAAITNARATRALRESGGLPGLLWSCATDESAPARFDLTAVPRSDDRSSRLAARLQAAGFTRIGPVGAQALLLAAGVVEVTRAEEVPLGTGASAPIGTTTGTRASPRWRAPLSACENGSTVRFGADGSRGRRSAGVHAPHAAQPVGGRPVGEAGDSTRGEM